MKFVPAVEMRNPVKNLQVVERWNVCVRMDGLELGVIGEGPDPSVPKSQNHAHLSHVPLQSR